MANIRRGSSVEVNVVDPLSRKGYRFKGSGSVHAAGTKTYEEGVRRMREAGSALADRVQAIVVIEVQEARTVVSPVYDDGALTEADVVRRFRARLAAQP